MKKLLIVAALVAASTSGLVAQTITARGTGDLTTLGGWDFNNGTAASVASVNARYNQQFAPTYFTAGTISAPGNANYGTVYFNSAANGATFANRNLASANAASYDLLSTVGLLASNNSLGDQTVNVRSVVLSDATLGSGRATFKISSLSQINALTSQGFADLNVAYSARNAGTSDATIDWSYSLDGINFVSIAGSSDAIVASGTAYNVYAADFSAIDAIEGVSNLWLGLNYSESGADAYTYLDNVAIYGTALAAVTIPEPSTYAALLGAAVVGFSLLRRRKAALVA